LAHVHLGIALMDQGKWAEAEAEYRKAIRSKPDYAEVHCILGITLGQQGRFAEALTFAQRGHELGIKTPGWRIPSAQLVRETKALVDLDARLPKILQGNVQPASAAERIQLASICQKHKQLTAAVRFYADAFAEQPKLADDLSQWHRYNVACAAALAGCGQGKDVGKLDEKERAHLRQQALAWLRTDLTTWGQRLDKEPDKARADVLVKMKHWQHDSDFAGVRGDAVDKLPESERPPWRKPWEDVETLRGRAAERKGAAEGKG
jgi:tetratricopeptide (TPR) repeat protein